MLNCKQAGNSLKKSEIVRIENLKSYDIRNIAENFF